MDILGKLGTLLLLALLGQVSGTASGQADDEIQRIRAEIQALRSDYDARLDALEARLAAAERRKTGNTSTTSTPSNQTGSSNRDSVTAGNAFNPQISLILDGNFYHDDLDGGGSELVGNAFQPSQPPETEQEHEHGGLDNGFNFREAELAFSATVDPYFDAGAYLSLEESGVELEEAWFETRSLPHGLKLKGGKFLSDFGYINRQHPHQWDFADQNLAHLNLLGDHGLRDTGVQLTWPPALPLYTFVGTEILQGNQERFGGFVEDDDTRSELGFSDRKDGPRLITAFVKAGPDLGYDHALQIGASYAHNRQHQEVTLEAEGDADLWGFDLVYKYDNPAPWGHRDLKLQTEYLRTTKNLTTMTGDDAGARQDITTDGYYLQGVYGIAPRWQLGLRYDVVGATNRISGNTRLSFDESDRWTVALTWVPTEFSRFRLQYARNDILIEPDVHEQFDAFWLQFLLSLGTHGAHRF
jgi:hypothetical protein